MNRKMQLLTDAPLKWFLSYLFSYFRRRKLSTVYYGTVASETRATSESRSREARNCEKSTSAAQCG